MAYVDRRFPPPYPWPAGVGSLGQGPIALQPFPPPFDLEELTEEERRKLDQAARIGLVVIVLGVGALVIDAILRRRR